jgi:hypothetical protein
MVYLLDLILLNNTPIKMPIMPYTIIFTIMAPINEEYLARGPNVSTALDSISPEVMDTNACDAISGINKLLKETLRINDMANAAKPAAIPQAKNTTCCKCNNFLATSVF